MLEENDYQKEVENLVGMLDSLRRITDKGKRKWLKNEIRAAVLLLTKD